jgi:hypothetical protein
MWAGIASYNTNFVINIPGDIKIPMLSSYQNNYTTIANSMGQSPPSEANSHSASQEIPRLL